MFPFLSKVILILLMNFVISVPLYAQVVEQNGFGFPIKTEALLKGEIHYFFNIIAPRKFAVHYPVLFELDSLSLAQESDVMMIANKTVYVVNKPVGFFEEKQLMDEKYMAHVMGDQKIKKLSPYSYLITVPGKDGFKYKTKSFFDSDDVSTLPNSRVMRAVAAAKKLDVISQGASTIMFTEKTNFTKLSEGGVTVSSFLPLKENKTLIITYNLWAVKRPSIQEKALKSSFLNEIEAVRNLQENYK